MQLSSIDLVSFCLFKFLTKDNCVETQLLLFVAFVFSGAIVGFNGLYKEFREDPDLKNAYTIILLTSFITSLSLSVASVTEEDSVILKSTKLAIAHVERILMKKKDSFNHVIFYVF